MTGPGYSFWLSGCISIHIPRVGDDSGEAAARAVHVLFQSTSPVWGMTGKLYARAPIYAISIHIPRVGDDLGIVTNRYKVVQFQSTSPVWGMTDWRRQ